MEDSNYFFKTIGLESYIGHDSLQRVDMENLDYNPLSEPKMKMEDHGKTEKDDVCEKQEEINEDVSQITANVQADDFFSSLELQSSSKTSSNMISLNFSNKLSGGIVTRSRSFSSTFHENSKMPEKIFPKAKAKRRPKREFQKKKSETVRQGRRVKTKGKNRKIHGKKLSPDGKDKTSTLSESKKQSSNKLEENILEKSLGLEKCKDDDDWSLFHNLTMKKEQDEKQIANDLQNSVRRTTPELFSMSSILMSDTMSEGKDDVDKLLEVDDYDDSFLEDMEEFNYAPPRSHTGGKWKPGSLSIRTSPMLWQNQNWDSLLDDRHQEEDRKNRAETPVDSPTESSGDKLNKFPPVPSTSGKWRSFAPPSSHTGGKWKPLTPPVTHTGGKWKPSERPKKFEQELLSADDSEQNWKCDSERGMEPPATHTGGKWKPNSSHAPEEWKPETSSKLKSGVPPSSHTRGKWVSEKSTVSRSTLDVLANCQSTSGKCLKTSGGMIQYYCSPCNRRLSSKKMYKKHILSELHFKRVLQENELEFDSRSLKLFHGLFTQSGYRERGLGKRVIKKPEMFKNSEISTGKKDKKMTTQIKTKNKKIRPRRELIRCEICKIRMPSHQMGKHLVSYYHSRRIRLNDPEQQKLILDNIHAIVKQAPYQCGICKFYCNTHTLFKNHWALDVHKELDQTMNKRFWCSLCSFECETSRSMELHLDSNSHREVILAVNKSIPIIIRHKVIFNCTICFKEFRFQRELIRHKQIAHELADGESGSVCSICEQKYKNMKSLQRHILFAHADIMKVPYFCSCCNEFFSTAKEAKIHRNSQLHKYKKTVSEGGDSKKGLPRTCSYCQKTLEDLSKFKAHLMENHTEFLPKCIKCGKVFALSQEVSRHVKNKECEFLEKKKQNSESFNCDNCQFSCSSKSEFLLHSTIHQQKRNEEKKIACPLCGSLFTQTALSIHLKTHLKEMTYQCSLCSRAFVRKDRYLGHLKSKHFIKENDENLGEVVADVPKEVRTEEKKGEKKEDQEEEEEVKQAAESEQVEKKMEKRQICGDAKCKYVAKDLDDLENHSLIHIGPKIYQCPECPYYAKTNTIIKRHYLKHIDDRSFPCPHCPFKARLKAHLKRHMRLHTGVKPYKCPHCPYTCNILENLRKHVLFTKIHPGKKLYECKSCEFDTNASKDFKSHLSKYHESEYKFLEINVVAGIYNREAEFTNASEPLPGKPRTQRPPKKPMSSAIKRKMEEVGQKFIPIAPKNSFSEKKIITPSVNAKTSGNSVEDKRKILQMELEKLKKQIKPVDKKSVRSYPSPAERDQKAKAGTSDGNDKVDGVSTAESTEDEVVLLNVTPTAEDSTFSPAYILYENVLPSEEMELYLLEDYRD